MLHYDRIDLSEGFDPAKSNNHKKCIVWHCCFFFNHGIRFQNYVCNRFHDFIMLRLNTGGITSIIVKDVDYGCIIHGISNS